MTVKMMIGVLLVLCVALVAVSADYQTGLEAFDQGDYATALKEWLPLAEQGNAAAQAMIGIMYQGGLGVPRSLETAVGWSRKAADQGSAAGQLLLAAAYLAGQDVPQDDSRAAHWLRKVADQGVASAQTQLGVFYANGGGVPKDDSKAVEWFQKAARQGDGDAQRHLGMAYGLGEGVPRNFILGYMWLTLAVASGAKDAVEVRDSLASAMPPDQIAEAQALARRWQLDRSESQTGTDSYSAETPEGNTPLGMPELWGSEVQAGLAELGQAETILCHFGPGHLTRWATAEPVSKETKFGDDPTVFHSLDVKKGTGKIGGNAGTADVSVLLTSTGLHLTLVMPNGNLTFTSVFPVHKPGSDDFIAVDSRHRLSPYPSPGGALSKVMPQQYHGTCKILSTK